MNYLDGSLKRVSLVSAIRSESTGIPDKKHVRFPFAVRNVIMSSIINKRPSVT